MYHLVNTHNKKKNTTLGYTVKHVLKIQLGGQWGGLPVFSSSKVPRNTKDVLQTTI